MVVKYPAMASWTNQLITSRARNRSLSSGKIVNESLHGLWEFPLFRSSSPGCLLIPVLTSTLWVFTVFEIQKISGRKREMIMPNIQETKDNPASFDHLELQWRHIIRIG